MKDSAIWFKFIADSSRIRITLKNNKDNHKVYAENILIYKKEAGAYNIIAQNGTWAGIWYSGSSPWISNNTIINNGHYGIMTT